MNAYTNFECRHITFLTWSLLSNLDFSSIKVKKFFHEIYIKIVLVFPALFQSGYLCGGGCVRKRTCSSSIIRKQILLWKSNDLEVLERQKLSKFLEKFLLWKKFASLKITFLDNIYIPGMKIANFDLFFNIYLKS